MTTRLDRLLLLLDTGSTPVIRKAAAVQLGEVIKYHPHELFNLISRVHVHLRSRSWDTRIAAGQAIEAIARNSSEWRPKVSDNAAGAAAIAAASEELNLTRLTFEAFDFERVLTHGAPLLSSAGREYDVDWSELTAREKLAIQKQRLYGIDDMFGEFADQAGVISADDLFRDEDLMAASTAATGKRKRGDDERDKRAAQVAEEINNTANLSAREKNRLKRMARAKKGAEAKAIPTERLLSRTRSSGAIDPSQMDADPAYSNTVTEQPASEVIVVESKKEGPSKLLLEQSNEWPLASFCEILCHDLFDPVWEIRHGAATALREVLKARGGTAGMIDGLHAAANELEHHRWLEDVAIRLICVFALDRFSDFVADQVVAPVRETCAQCLGALLHYMSATGVQRTQAALLRLTRHDTWEIRHGGFLGLRYIAAVRIDLVDQLLPASFQTLMQGLPDLDDDVRAVAASALLPVVEGLLRMPAANMNHLLCALDSALLKLDDLTASTSAVVDLLAALLSIPAVLAPLVSAGSDSMRDNDAPSLASIVEHLLPFFRHPVANVRRAVVRMLRRLLDAYDNEQWLHSLVVPLLRLVFQNLLLEELLDIHQMTAELWECAIDRFPPAIYTEGIAAVLPSWHGTLRTPVGILFDADQFLVIRHSKEAAAAPRPAELSEQPASKRQRAETPQQPPSASTLARKTVDRALDDILRASDFTLVPPTLIYKNREAAAVAYGRLLRRLNGTVADQLVRWLQQDVSSDVAFHRQVGYIIIAEWAAPACELLVPALEGRLIEAAAPNGGEAASAFADLMPVLLRLRAECAALLAAFAANGVPAQVLPRLPDGEAFTVAIANALLGDPYDQLLALLPPRHSAHERDYVLNDLEARRQRVVSAISFWSDQSAVLHRSVNGLAAAALIALNRVPSSFNLTVKPLMLIIGSGTQVAYLQRMCDGLTALMVLCADRPALNDRILHNICKLVCGSAHAAVKGGEHGILAHRLEHQLENGGAADEGAAETAPDALARPGAELALATISRKFGEQLFARLPGLWDIIRTPLQAAVPDDATADTLSFDGNDDQGKLQAALMAMDIFCVLLPAVHRSHYPALESVAVLMVRCLRCPCSALRREASRALAIFCRISAEHAVPHAVRHVHSALVDSASVVHRRGGAELVLQMLREMQDRVLPYAVLLLVPAMERMSDQDADVRLVCAASFAELVKVVPLDSGSVHAPGLDAALEQRRAESRAFLEQLLDAGRARPYRIPVPINAQLRAYQQDGVNWLAFLKQYHLNGILCDDMGLGKTLQSICILASAHHEHADSKPVSLVICPTTVTGHWEHEIRRFVGSDLLKPVVYAGQPAERKRIAERLRNYSVVIASYEILRNDLSVFRDVPFLYCILDEGHIIKNAKSKTAQAVKAITAEHRLMLTGTPIQNNVVELWALFDFLMPGFLGTQRQFAERYGKPILASGDPKATAKDQEGGALALEALHKQVLPFILRRMKSDVLQDLPPKIIQDYRCELTPIQRVLYESFSREQAPHIKDMVRQEDHAAAGDAERPAGPTRNAVHVFQALQYLRKVCDHPLLVLTPDHPRRKELLGSAATVSPAASVEMSAKLSALKDLLHQCGIGDAEAAGSSSAATGAAMTAADVSGVAQVGRHRALIFCQFKSMIDIIERDLLKPMGGSVAWLRLDGTVPQQQRHSVVRAFNEDPSVDLLLLTTQVGGVGLNLTGADTVIFMEHDWNPQKDVQAMDRAHRIGQRNVVNVYRLITRGTLEEKIMGLQTFKLKIANTIVNADNKSLQSMSTDQLLDLFELSSANALEEVKATAPAPTAADEEATAATAGVPVAARGMLQNLESLWNEDSYTEEYDLDSFLRSLKQ